MSSESQHIEEAAGTAPKPSAVRRSGKMTYTRRSRIGRLGLNPPSTGRLVVNQQTKENQPLRPRYPLKPRISSPESLPKDQPKDENEAAGQEDKAEVLPISSPERVLKVQPNDENEAAGQANDDEVRDEIVIGKTLEKPDIEEKKVDTPDASQAILDDKLFGYQDNVMSADVVEEVSPSAFMSTFNQIQGDGELAEVTEKKSEDRDRDIATIPSESDEPLSRVPVVHLKHPSQNEARARVYHRPHTNQTVIAGSNNNDDDTKSTASGLSQPSWVSQTSVGNSKRRARLGHGKKRNSRSRRGKYSSDDSRDSNTMGRVVSQAFDKMLGYAGGRQHEHEDGYSSDESEGIITELQEALLSTFGCSGPQPVNTKTNNDDDFTVESRQSHQSPRHVRSVSNMSGSILSTISGSAMGSVLTFDTTEELADFRKEKNKNQDRKRKENDDANASKLQGEKSKSEEIGSVASNSKATYSEDTTTSNSKEAIYSEDVLLNVKGTESKPVDLLADGDRMLDSMGNDLLKVANTKVDAMFTSIGTLLGAKPLYKLDEIDDETKTDGSTTESMTLESVSVMKSLSNVTEPLQVITENDGELSPVRGNLPDKQTSEDFEDRYEISVFETIESDEGTEVVETTQTIGSFEATNASQEIKAAGSAASLFQGINDQENQSQENQSPVESQVESPAEPEESRETQFEAKQEGRDENDTKVDNSAWNELLDFPETKPTDVNNLDQKDLSPSDIPEESIEKDVTTDSPVVHETPTLSVSEDTDMLKKEDTAALKAPESKKPKKFTGIKKLIRRSFKKRKNKKSSDVPLSSTLEESSSPPGGAPMTPLAEVSDPSVSVSPQLASSSPEVTRVEEKPVDVEEVNTKEQPGASTKDTWVDFGDENKATNISLPSCPTTPVREPEVVLDTPKTSNLGLEERKLTRPVSGTNLADLPGIEEADSFREVSPAKKTEVANKENVPAAQPVSNIISSGSINNNDGFDLSLNPSSAFEQTNRVSVDTEASAEEVSFDEFHLDYDITAEHSWEAFGQSPDDLGAAAYRQKALEDAMKGSPQKVSQFPGLATGMAEF